MSSDAYGEVLRKVRAYLINPASFSPKLKNEIVAEITGLLAAPPRSDAYKRPKDYWCNDDEQVRIIEDALDCYEASLRAAPPSNERAVADAWLVIHVDGSKEVVMSPLTDATFIDDGEKAWPLYRAATLPQNDTPASEDIVTLRERVESAEYRAAEYQRINGLHNTELDSLREQLATAKAGLRVVQSESVPQSATAPRKWCECRAPSTTCTITSAGGWYCHSCGASELEPECRYLRGVENGKA